ncbi:S8/S53 family peptidase [Cellulomonas sp.]|uniref:S8 family peptidase n=1 Tax=Cellulomonas sp. TaxID=40001 RepID=UPI001B2C4A2E|nr:S8/S53 family peptidase [Cellulomonas sp.]MBO9556424.1 S8/S53 family peptidase [Cellulomonas sp.]
MSAEDDVEVVVALDHLQLVQRLLARHEVPCEVPDELTDADLGLALLRLSPGSAKRLVTALSVPQGHPGHHAWVSGRSGERPVTVDDVLVSLRSTFERRYAGWVPTLGKNRLVGSVNGGGGSVSHGGGPAPTAANRPARWRHGTAGEGVTVGVLDTALYAHPELAGGYLGASSTDVLADSSAADATLPFAAGHATFVTGIVLDQAPRATVRVRAVLKSGGDATSWDVAKAIVSLGRTGIQVLNLSLVCYTEDNKPPLVLSTAVDRLPPDVLVIACAGNHGDPVLALADDEHRRPSWPAALDDVVAVGSAPPGSVPGRYEPSAFTPLDAEWIDVLTVGEQVVSTYFTGKGAGATGEPTSFHGWAQWGGTSFSAALLTGKVAARASIDRTSARAAYAALRPAPPTSPLSLPDDGPYLPPFLPS